MARVMTLSAAPCARRRAPPRAMAAAKGVRHQTPSGPVSPPDRLAAIAEPIAHRIKSGRRTGRSVRRIRSSAPRAGTLPARRAITKSDGARAATSSTMDSAATAPVQPACHQRMSRSSAAPSRPDSSRPRLSGPEFPRNVSPVIGSACRSSWLHHDSGPLRGLRACSRLERQQRDGLPGKMAEFCELTVY